MTWPRLSEHTLVSRFCDRLVVLDRRTGSVYKPDAVAAFVLAHRDMFADLDDAATTLHEVFGSPLTEIRSQLADLDAAVGAIGRAPPRRTSRAPTAHRVPRPAGPPAFATVIDGLGSAIEVRCFGALVADVVEPLLAGHPSSGAPPTHRIDIWETGGHFAVAENGTPTIDAGDLFVAVTTLLTAIFVVVRDAPSERLRVHAAAVATGDAATVITGDAGQGKSSTTVELLARGGRGYLSDEIVELDLSSGRVHGLARPIGLEGPARLSHPGLCPPWWDNDWWYPRWPVAPEHLAPVPAAAALAGLVVVEYRPDAPTQLLRLDPLDALAWLGPMAYNPGILGPSELARLGDRLAEVPAVLVRHPGAPWAADAIGDWEREHGLG